VGKETSLARVEKEECDEKEVEESEEELRR